MNNELKLLGGSRQELYTGVGAHTPPSGFAFYGIKVRVAASTTLIASLSEKRSKNAVAVVVTNKTWEGTVGLVEGDFINFEYPVTSITLTNATDSIWAYCIPYLTTV
jgi:hypothetical protein